MTPELKPCPFCGWEASAIPDPNHSTGWEVGCFSGNCDVEPHVWSVHRSTAEMQWNTRADIHDATKAQLAKAVEALRRIAGQPDYRLPEPQDIASAVMAEIEKGEPK